MLSITNPTKWCECKFGKDNVFYKHSYDTRCRGWFANAATKRSDEILITAPYKSQSGEFVYQTFMKFVKLKEFPSEFAVSSVDINPFWKVYSNIMSDNNQILDYFYLIDNKGLVIIHSLLTQEQFNQDLL